MTDADLTPWRPGDPPVNKVLYEAPNGDLFHPDNDDETIRDLVADILVRPDTLFVVVTEHGDRARGWFDHRGPNMHYVSTRASRLLGVRPEDYAPDDDMDVTSGGWMREFGRAIREARRVAGVPDVFDFDAEPPNLHLVTRAAPAVEWTQVYANKVSTAWQMTVDGNDHDVFMCRSVFPGSTVIVCRSADSACAAAELALLGYAAANSPTTQRSET